jgi:hypothetical protein
MRKIVKVFLVLLVLILCTMNQSLAAKNKKLAQTGFQFLSVISDGKAAAMAGAVNSLELQSSSLFFNPAGMANQSSLLDISLSNNRWIADIRHNTLTISVNPLQGRFGVLGLSIQTVDYGDKFYGTIVAPELDQGYLDTGELSPSTYSIGIGYAKALSHRFSVGGQIKKVKQEFNDLILPQVDSLSVINDSTTTKRSYRLSPYAFDFGTQFKTGIKSLTFAMSVRNFSKEIKYVDEGFQLPLVFTLGISMNMMDLFSLEDPAQHSLIMSVDATHYRDHPEQLIIGIDYRMMNVLSVRGGYVSGNDEDNINFGMGITWHGVSFDYAYTPFGVFGNVQRVTARFSL